MIPVVIDSNKELLNSTLGNSSFNAERQYVDFQPLPCALLRLGICKSPFIFDDKVDKVRITENGFGSFY
jgi:hypothetical protein